MPKQHSDKAEQGRLYEMIRHPNEDTMALIGAAGFLAMAVFMIGFIAY